VSQGSQPPLHRRIGFRIALGTAIGFFVLSWITVPAWDYLFRWFHPEEHTGLKWYENWTLGELVAVSLMYTSLGLTLGACIGYLVSKRSLSPLQRIAREVAEPFGPEDPLPGPFDAAGDDEVAQLATALNAMRARGIDLRETLTSRDAQRREWIAQVSHDLRTPLTALVACLDLLEVRARRLDDDRSIELVDAARHDTDRVLRMAKDLLRIARLELDDKLNKEAVLPGELIEATAAGLAPLATEQGLELEIDADEDLPTIEVDGRLVLRGLENLVANSVRHATSRIEVAARRTEAGVRFTVLDDGPGLPQNGQPIDFAGLRKARSGADSSGLGLMVTERVARAHGGRTGCSNRPTGGAEVWFELPV